MIRWIRENNWLPEVLVTLTVFMLVGGLDTIFRGPIALIPAALYALALLFVRHFNYLAAAFMVAGTAAHVFFELQPTLSLIISALSVYLLAAFASTVWRHVAVIVSNACAIWYLWQAVVLEQTGWVFWNPNAKWAAFVLCALLAVAANTAAWGIGRLLMIRLTHVGTDFDRAKMLHSQARLGIEIAKQTERLGVARDLTDLLVQRVSAVVSLSDAGKFIAKADPESSARTLERVSDAATGAQVELRRLYDLLHEEHELTAAPPRLADIEPLVVAMRELGYNSKIHVDGEPYLIEEGAELCIFKIVFESLENVKKHAGAGTEVTVDFFWTKEGLQLLIKDNAVESARKLSAPNLDSLGGYSIDDDLTALVEKIDGATISVLAERAALYEGTIEATRVPGVGFTLSALFPHLRAVAGLDR